jgi:cephalosporin-C deacetylase-like acetyl esterase
MQEPDDFGLSNSLTLLQVGAVVPPPGFQQFWSEWAQRVWHAEPSLERWDGAGPDPGCEGVTHVYRSTGDVRIGCRVTHGAGGTDGKGGAGGAGQGVRAVVVSLHGYGMAPGQALEDGGARPAPGVAHIQVRCRGYPGSQIDCPDLTASPEGYIARGLEGARTWVLGDAVADVVNATRAARARFGPDVPVSIKGESFGGALAVLAASALASRGPVARLVCALPSLGWWSWRLEHTATAGIGLDVQRLLQAQRQPSEATLEALRFFDTLVHARRVTCPVVCKVAERDDVVPAPTAAAVYNAFGTDPGLKWRFVTRYGHFDGGIADARRHALFEQLADQFLDPAVDPAALMGRWEPVLASGDRGPG